MIIRKAFAAILTIGLFEFYSEYSKCSAREEEYVEVNNRERLHEIDQWPEKPKRIVITSRESFEKGTSFFCSLGKKAHQWGVTHLDVSNLNITVEEANKHIKVLLIWWGKSQKIDLSHNNIATYPTDLIVSTNRLLELLDLSDNPIPVYCLNNAQKGLDLQNITTKVVFPTIKVEEDPIQKKFLIPNSLIGGAIRGTSTYLRKKTPPMFLSLFEKHYKNKKSLS